MKLWAEGLMGGDDEIAEYENGGAPWCITYTFMPDELENLLNRLGVRNVMLAGPRAYARTLPNELLVKIMRDPQSGLTFWNFVIPMIRIPLYAAWERITCLPGASCDFYKSFTKQIISEVLKMAQAYPYQYNGELRMKQNKCRAAMPLDKARIWLDFNEFCGIDKDNEAPVYLFSQADIVNNSDGNDVELYDGMEVSVFDDDLDISNAPDALLADGVIIRNFLEQYPNVKWLIRLVKHKMNYKSGEEYVYWMSDLQFQEKLQCSDA